MGCGPSRPKTEKGCENSEGEKDCENSEGETAEHCKRLEGETTEQYEKRQFFAQSRQQISDSLLEHMKGKGCAAGDHSSFRFLLTEEEKRQFYDIFPTYRCYEEWKNPNWMKEYDEVWNKVWAARPEPHCLEEKYGWNAEEDTLQIRTYK